MAELWSPSSFICTLLLVGWLVTGPSGAARITSEGHQNIYVAEGDNMLISCEFELDSSDTGELDIEWAIINPDTTKRDVIILTYVHGQVFDYPSVFRSRFSFVESDPSQGNASVSVRALRISDTNTFQCKVKKAPGIDTKKVTVGVHVRPQVPRCWADRSDQNVVLHCHSDAGSPPLTYTWERISGAKSLPRSSTTGSGSETLVIRNTTETLDGTYRCRAQNLVGQEECELILAAPAGKSDSGVIIGAVVGTLLALLLLMLLILLLCCCCRKRNQEKDKPYDIREDAAPPLSTAPSLRSVKSYKVHQARKHGRVTFYNALPMIDNTQPLTADQPMPTRRSPVSLTEGSRLDFVV
ncbi:coxsackievirus and adenovirus receptor homolog [Rhinoraja longicauda]